MGLLKIRTGLRVTVKVEGRVEKSFLYTKYLSINCCTYYYNKELQQQIAHELSCRPATLICVTCSQYKRLFMHTNKIFNF